MTIHSVRSSGITVIFTACIAYNNDHLMSIMCLVVAAKAILVIHSISANILITNFTAFLLFGNLLSTKGQSTPVCRAVKTVITNFL